MVLVLQLSQYDFIACYFTRFTFDIARLSFYGAFAEGVHLFPYRTEQLSPSWPMVLGFGPGE